MTIASLPFRYKGWTGGPLSQADAVDIWIARWLRIRRKDLLLRYGCDPRRLYEIWEEKRFPGSRTKALALFAERYPGLVDRIDFGLHRRIPQRRFPPELQPGLFDRLGARNKLRTFARRGPGIAACSLYVPAASVRPGGNDPPPLPRCPRDPAMRTYLITYDAAAPHRHSLAGAIMQLGEAWARPLEHLVCAIERARRGPRTPARSTSTARTAC